MSGMIIILIFIVALFLIANKWRKDITLLRSVTGLFRGTWSERKLVIRLLKNGLPSNSVFHDLYVETEPGKYSQIDTVAITDVGIIVFEVKDYSGWIFGNGYQTYWTKVLAYGKEKYRFYNPVLQNKGHINALRKRIGVKTNIPFYSVIIFYGNCRLKKIRQIPEETYIGYSRNLKLILNSIINNHYPIHYDNKQELMSLLSLSVDNGRDRRVKRQHIKNIRKYSR